MYITDAQGGLYIETIGNDPLIAGTQTTTPKISFITVLLHFPVSLLKNKRYINATDVHLPSMRVQPEEPAIENITRPVT